MKFAFSYAKNLISIRISKLMCTHFSFYHHRRVLSALHVLEYSECEQCRSTSLSRSLCFSLQLPGTLFGILTISIANSTRSHARSHVNRLPNSTFCVIIYFKIAFESMSFVLFCSSERTLSYVSIAPSKSTTSACVVLVVCAKQHVFLNFANL